MLVSCGTSRKQTKALSAKPVAELTPEQQRKYDYFFLEAARLKIQKDYDAYFMIPGSKGLNTHELAHKWVNDLGTPTSFY